MALIDGPVTQETFAAIVGISQPRVAQLVDEGTLERNATLRTWLRAYCDRLREQAAGRGQELTMERAALARSQRIGQELKNAEIRGELAPIGLLADVLGTASAAVASRLAGIPGDLKRVCPDLPDSARQAIETALAHARNEWVRQTANLVQTFVDEMEAAEDDDYAGLQLAEPPASIDTEGDDA